MTPMAAPELANPAQTAIALERSSGGNTAARIERVPGMSSAAPAPCTPRMAISVAGSPATVAANDIEPKKNAAAGVRRKMRKPLVIAAVPVAMLAGARVVRSRGPTGQGEESGRCDRRGVVADTGIE